ncbi:MAG: hypothetical protein OWU33_03120 [Firmicutes bacterium]|nr:hypothetical protein [Bacillota bacterium]
MAKQELLSATFITKAVLEMRTKENTVTEMTTEYGMHFGPRHWHKRQPQDNSLQRFVKFQRYLSLQPIRIMWAVRWAELTPTAVPPFSREWAYHRTRPQWPFCEDSQCQRTAIGGHPLSTNRAD